MMRSVGAAMGVALAVSLAGAGARASGEPLTQATTTVPQHRLLDVGLHVLDPGIDEDRDTEALEKQGIFRYLRRSEARCMPFELKDTMEQAGLWGAVRVVPGDDPAVDLLVTGEILKSTGKDLALEIRARDSTGHWWIKKRTYKAAADAEAYLDASEDPADVGRPEEPYRDLYVDIANDLAAYALELTDGEMHAIRTVTQLRFAEDLAPDAFRGYLSENRRGRVRVERLPSDDDPMFSRVGRIRETDHEFVDTLNQYYDRFCSQMDEPYDAWRGYSYQEQLALQKARRKARTKQILGTLLFLGGAVAGAESDSSVAGAAADAAQIAGALLAAAGFADQSKIKVHKETLRELAGSLDAEVEPMVDEVEGYTLRLSGSAEAQYAEFRRLLREIFAAETGLPLQAEPEPEVESASVDGAQPVP